MVSTSMGLEIVTTVVFPPKLMLSNMAVARAALGKGGLLQFELVSQVPSVPVHVENVGCARTMGVSSNKTASSETNRLEDGSGEVRVNGHESGRRNRSALILKCMVQWAGKFRLNKATGSGAAAIAYAGY